MAEYIERDQILGYLDLVVIHARGVAGNDSILKKVTGIVENMRDLVAEAPSADVVPVVRCKDCKHWKKGDFMGGDTPDSMEYGGGCPLVRFARYESDFCSKGERKDGE